MKDVYSIFLEKNKNYSEIQKIAIPIVKEMKNCLIVAPTGYGKTEAAVLPLIDIVSKERRPGLSVIYITPLRALNRDMIRRLEAMCTAVGVRIGVRHGDTSQKEKRLQVERSPEILITTPETLQSILVNPKFRVALRSLRAVVVDELHELYHNKRGAQLSVGLERLVEISGEYQRIGISATVGDKEILAKVLCGDRECMVADVGVSKSLKLTVELPSRYAECMKDVSKRFDLDDDAIARLWTVSNHIAESKSTLIFANTRQVVEAVGSRLVYTNTVKDFGGIGVHHSSLDRQERINLENSFKNSEVKSIIATSSLELGIDIGSIDSVVQYGSPRQSLRLTQRVGRSGHSITGTPRGFIIPLNTIDALEAVVLCDRATKGSFESYSPHFNALDVLANQVCGIARDTGGVHVDKIHSILQRSFVYKTLTKAELTNLLEFMAKQHMIGFGGETVTPGGRTKIYYYKHLSVISDVRRFVVKNIIEHKIISTLDERFVANNVEEGSVFITKGLPWKVISIDEDVVNVEPSTDLEAAVPDWQGEDIPVSYDTAQGVLHLLKAGMEKFERFVDAEAYKKLEGFLSNQSKYYIPSQNEIVIEALDNYRVMYTWLGTAANDALSKVLAHNIGTRLGRGVGIKTSPYAIFIELESGFDLLSVIDGLNPSRILTQLRDDMAESELFRYKFLSVAKLFGIIDRDAAVSRSMIRRLMKLMDGTPVYEETLRELLSNYIDTKALVDFVRALSSRRLKIREIRVDAGTPLTKELVGYSYSAKELIAPLTPNNELVAMFSRYMLSKSAKLLCTYCGFNFTRSLEEIRDIEVLVCPSCKSPLLVIHDDSYKTLVDKKLLGKRLSRTENGAFVDMMNEAGLISAYGQRAVIALSVYGVGVKTAARALLMRKGTERDFFIDLIEAQKTFIRTKKYWSV